MAFPKTVFKRYDIRGFADKELDEDFAYAVGNAFVQHHGFSAVVVGRDVRQSSPSLAAAVMRGVLDAGADVLDLGVISTSRLKWTVAEKGYAGAIMVTASHNPPAYNGFKFYLADGLPFDALNGMHELYPLLAHPVKKTRGSVAEQDFLGDYTQFLLGHLSSHQRLVFVDPSGGAACREVKDLVEKGSFSWTLYNAEEDPLFRLHSPNPVDPSATEAARDFCGMHACIGAVLDADSDRIILIDEEGKDVPADYLGAFLAKHLLRDGGGVTRTVRDSLAVEDVARELGVDSSIVPVGNAIVQREMLEKRYVLGVEKSGHLFFQESHYAEAPLLALLYVLTFLGDERLCDAIGVFREQYFSSPEWNVTVSDKDSLLKAAEQVFGEQGVVDTLDGVSCRADDWWCNIRPSNTEPLVRITWEARDQETFALLKEDLTALVQPFIQS